MSIPRVESGKVVQVAVGNRLAGSQTMHLVTKNDLQLMRFIHPAGKVVPLQTALDAITVQG